MTFEPTQAQEGVDPNPWILIDPEAIPYPLTDIWSLNFAAETLRTGGEELSGGAQDMQSAWNGLQAHYVAPESETLFAAMNPVVTRGEDIESDLVAVAGALEDLAEAAKTAQSSLNTLKIEAQGFWNEHHHKKVWWLTKDDETDDWAILENIRLKDGVNAAWSAFNEAENACATTISALSGGPAYASPDQAGGDDVRVYGLPTDAGEREPIGFDDFYGPANDFTAWVGSEFHPSMATWGNSTGQAAWDTIVVDTLWGSVVGLAALGGTWHPDHGWQYGLPGRWNNIKSTVSEGWMDAATFVGVHDDQGWLFSSDSGGQGGEGSRWDRWKTNIGVSWDEAVEGHTAWSTRDEGPGYSNTTTVINTALWTGGLPIKLVKTVLTLGPGGDASVPTSRDGSYSESADQTSTQGGRPPAGPSSPLPRDLEEGNTPVGERFELDLTVLRESLLDPDQYGNTPTPTPQPNTPSPIPHSPEPGDGGDRTPQTPTAPQRGDSPTPQGDGTLPNRPRNEDTPRQPGEDDQLAPHPRDADADAPRRSGQEADVPAPTTHPDTEAQSGDTDPPRAEERPEHRPTGRNNDESNGQGNDRPQRGDDDQEGRGGPREEPEHPEPAPGGGEGGGDQPPRDRPGTGGDDGDSAANDRDGSDDPVPERPEPTNPDNQKPDHSGPMSPELRPELRDTIQQVPGFRQLSFDDRDYASLFNSLENKRSTVGAQTADMILQGRLTNVEGFSDIIASLKNRNDLPARNQEMRIATDLLDSGFPPDRVAFPGKNQITKEDLDVAVRGEDGRIEYGYQAKVVENPEGIKSALKKIKKQFPMTTEATHRGGIIEANFEMSALLDRDLKALHDSAKAENISFHIHFQDGTLDFPPGTPLYPTN
ncbi:hypothetical protein ACFWTE_16675 [Nocardiopsis sp. NPDC058631]|uniref:hypothetical protein n=1 Tax=Nocardiopsis sp. NPDC058631 TaxID=3346566 RepID=UPI0036564386